MAECGTPAVVLAPTRHGDLYLCLRCWRAMVAEGVASGSGSTVMQQRTCEHGRETEVQGGG